MAIVTYLNRAALFIISVRFQLPNGWQRALRFAPAAALCAIAIPDLFLHQGQIVVSLDKLRPIAGLSGLMVAILTHSSVLAITVGMAALHGLQRMAGSPGYPALPSFSSTACHKRPTTAVSALTCACGTRAYSALLRRSAC